jgi:hypothetical protein
LTSGSLTRNTIASKRSSRAATSCRPSLVSTAKSMELSASLGCDDSEVDVEASLSRYDMCSLSSMTRRSRDVCLLRRTSLRHATRQRRSARESEQRSEHMNTLHFSYTFIGSNTFDEHCCKWIDTSFMITCVLTVVVSNK